MKKFLGTFLAVAIILTGVFGNINIVQAAGSNQAYLDDYDTFWIVDEPMNQITSLNIDPDQTTQTITFQIFSNISEEISDETEYNLKCTIESLNTDILEIIDGGTCEGTINKDSYYDGYGYDVFASVQVKVKQPGVVGFKVTDYNDSSISKTQSLTVTSPGFWQSTLTIEDGNPQFLEIWDQMVVSNNSAYSYASLNPNVATVSETRDTNTGAIEVTPVANGTTYIIGGNDVIGFMVCKVDVTGMGEAADLEWQEYTEPQGDVRYAFLVTGYDIETLGVHQLSNGVVNNTRFKGVYLNRFKDKVDADHMRFSISSIQLTETDAILQSMKELVEADGKNENNQIGLFVEDMDACYGLRTTAFPYIKVFKKNQSVLDGGIYGDLNSFMCGEEVASFKLGNMDYDETSGQIYVKEGILQDGEDYVLVIEPEFQMFKARKSTDYANDINRQQSANHYLYFDFTTLSSSGSDEGNEDDGSDEGNESDGDGEDNDGEESSKIKIFTECVSQLEESGLSYTSEYAELLESTAGAYNDLSDSEKQDENVKESYTTYLIYQNGYQKVDNLFTSIQELGRSTVTANSINDIQAVLSKYDELTSEDSPYKECLSGELKERLDNEMADVVEPIREKYRKQTITVEQDKFTLNYSPNATFTIKASSDRNGAISYTSSKTSVATVDTKGVVTVKGVGTTDITVKAAGNGTDLDEATKTVTLTVNKGTQTITVRPGSIAAKFKLNASVVSGGGGLTYSSSKTSIATVDANGQVTVKGAGTVTFTIKAAESALYKATTKTVTMDITAVKGKTYTVGNLNYKVTNAKTNGNGTVTVTGVKTKKATVTIGKTVKIGNHSYKITAVGAGAFKNNKKLTSVSVGANVTTIGANAFYGCTKLKKATLGKGVTSIGSKAFYGDKLLAKITVKSSSLKKVGTKAFKGIKSTAVIDVPNKKVTAYKKLMKGKGQGSKVKIK